jgi:glycine/D-amino acid oxidase-like deaminating enzyme/nitrite reductase/ring-hydroxylating ferredoxin subunit
MDTTPFWKEKELPPRFPALARDLDVEVLVIGGGITGVSTAHLLAKGGHKVALVECYRLGVGDTGHTTAHLTYMTDTRLSELIHICGAEDAEIAWKAGHAAMDHIREVAGGLEEDVSLTEVPGYLVVAKDGDMDKETSLLRKEEEQAILMGFHVEFLNSVPPTGRPGLRFEDQLKFHPLHYLHAIVREAVKSGATIHEETKVTEFLEDGRSVIANGQRITFQKVVIATHVPLQGSASTTGAAMFQTKLASYSTYAIAAEYPTGTLPEMIWSDTADPFNYLRVDRLDGRDLVILGGEDHKTGQRIRGVERFAALEKRLVDYLGQGKVINRWSGQVVEPVDGMPYIGQTSDEQFIATGFSGNGLTFGVASALMANHWVEGRDHPWIEAFSPSRRKIAATWDYLNENRDYPYRMVKDRQGVPHTDPSVLRAGQGCVVKAHGDLVAACRDSEGSLHQLSAVCPHLGCVVAWNEAEQTWDCPCHGSRFLADGKVIAGPAEENLQPIEHHE